MPRSSGLTISGDTERLIVAFLKLRNLIEAEFNRCLPAED